MRCFDGPKQQQQRRDPHTSRAQRARGRCAYARTGWNAKFVMDGLVASARDASLNLPHFRYYHSIVAPWLVVWGASVGGGCAGGVRLLCCLLCSACFVACCYCMTAGWGETEVLMDVSSRRLALVQHRHLPARGGACRRRSCSATAAPREGGRRRGHGDGRHHPRPVAQFLSPNSDRR